VVIDLAVEHNADRFIRCPHRLCAACDVDDGKAPMSQIHSAVGIAPNAFRIGPARCLRSIHARDIIARPVSYEASYPAHGV
jgi:hypothetical protein